MDERKFGGRAYFQAAARPAAALIIDNTTNADSGLYRCRVDFHKSPTRNARVQLRVISKCFEEERKDGRYFREQRERTMESGVEWSGEESVPPPAPETFVLTKVVRRLNVLIIRLLKAIHS